MKLTKYLAGTAICVLSLQFYFQTQAQQLEIGDPVPDLLLEQVVNYPGGSAHFSDFDGKLIIIDFWETWCVPCVRGLPHMQQLQQEFDGQLQVLLDSTKKATVIDVFLQKKNISLPSVTEGRYLIKLFPHKFVPYQVWIKDRKVFALTTHEAVTTENIRGVLSGKLSSLPEKKFDFNYKSAKPLLLDGNGGSATVLQFRSLITGYIDGIGGGGVGTDSLGLYKIRTLNGSILQLYLSVFKLGVTTPLGHPNRCIVDPEVAKLMPPRDIPEYSPEVRDKYYCYELIVPPALKDQANELMLEDLNRFFGALYRINAKIEKRSMECWALKQTGSTEKLLSRSEKPRIDADTPGQLSFSKQPVSELCRVLSILFKEEHLPLVDRTGISSDIDLTFPTNVTDIARFNSFLQSYGLSLQRELCDIDMLVIEQTN